MGDFGTTVKFYLKNTKMVRIIAKPIIENKRLNETREYIKSSESRRLKSLKNLYLDRRCFIVGNGPSLILTDLEKLNDEICFSSNRIYKIYSKTGWRPDYYVAFEPEFVKSNATNLVNIEVKKGRFINKVGKCNEGRKGENYWINCYSKFSIQKMTTDNIMFSEDISEFVYDSYTVTFTILQIVMYMGFHEIYLIGMDHNKADSKTSHFYQDSKNEYRTPTYWEGIEKGYSLAKNYAEKRGIDIYNATRGGYLEIFKRVDLDSIL